MIIRLCIKTHNFCCEFCNLIVKLVFSYLLCDYIFFRFVCFLFVCLVGWLVVWKYLRPWWGQRNIIQLLGFLSSVFVAVFLLYVWYILLSVAAVITVMHIDGNTQLDSAVKGAKYCCSCSWNIKNHLFMQHISI